MLRYGEQEAFDKLKTDLWERPILALNSPKVDANRLVLRSILMKRSEGGVTEFKLVACFSWCTTPTEQMYYSNKLEALAVVEFIRKYTVYLIRVHFKVITDSNAVRATLFKRDLEPRIARLRLVVQEHDMEVEYREGEVCNMWMS